MFPDVADKLTLIAQPQAARAKPPSAHVRKPADAAVDVRWSVALFDLRAAAHLQIGPSGVAISLRVGICEPAPADSDVTH